MSTVEATDKESRAVARARKKADRIRDKHANDLPRSMQPSALVKTITIVVLVFALIYFLFPIYWAIIASTKTPSQMTGSNGLWFAVGLSDLPAAIAKNYGTLIGWTRGQFWRWVLNSLIYSGVSALVGTLVAVMAGYATAKFNFKGKNLAIGVIMGCMLMPAALLTIPQYSIFHAMHLTNTMLSIIIPCCVSPFGFFLGRVYAQTSVPNELLEAARIDGASEARIFVGSEMCIRDRDSGSGNGHDLPVPVRGHLEQLPAAVDDGLFRHLEAGDLGSVRHGLSGYLH